jgi:hypothetical protein
VLRDHGYTRKFAIERITANATVTDDEGSSEIQRLVTAPARLSVRARGRGTRRLGGPSAGACLARGQGR